MGYRSAIDWSLAHSINAAVSSRDWLEDPVTAFAAVCVPLVAALTFSLWLTARPFGPLRWKLACLSALTSAALALAANQVIAHLWERERPFSAHPGATHLLAAASPDPSFPSDHAAAAFAIAVAVLAFSRPLGGFFLALATAIGVSRVALGVHYPGDVLAGALVGTLAALLVIGPGRTWIIRATVLLSRVSDPLFMHLLRRLRTLR